MTTKLAVGSSSAGSLIATLFFVTAACLFVAYMATPLVQLYRHRGQVRPRFAIFGRDYPGSTWDGRPVHHICRTLFVLWNAGSRTITAAELSADHPICVRVNGRVLDHALLHPREGAHVRRVGAGLRVTFEALRGYPPGEIQAPRGLCLQVVHDSSDLQLRVSGRVGSTSLEETDRENNYVAQPLRSRWAFLAGGAGLVGSSIWWFLEQHPDWLNRQFLFHRDVAWKGLLLVAVGVAVAFMAIFWANVNAFDRSLITRPGDDGYDDGTNSWLWMQRVPRELRNRECMNEASFLSANSGRMGTKPMHGSKRRPKSSQ